MSSRRRFFRDGGAPIPQRQASFGKPNIPEEELSSRQRDVLARDEVGRIIVYTDGAAINPTDPRRRRATWAVRAAFDHPWNASGPVDTPLQTAFRGELMAVLHAVKSAVIPTRIVSDCMAVVNIVRAELEGSDVKVTGDHADLWGDLRQSVRDRGPGFIAIEWINSHIPLDVAADVERAGGFERRHIEGNRGADKDANTAMRNHPINWTEYAKADDREFVAVVAQALIETVWSAVFEQDQEMRDADECDEGDERGRGEHDRAQDARDDYGDDGGGDAGFDMDPIDLSNKQLAQHIRHCTPGFGWGPPAERNIVPLQFNDLAQNVQVRRRGHEFIKGRGKISIAYAHPPSYLEPIRWWWDRLRWMVTPPGTIPNDPKWTATDLECVVGMELATGFRIEADGGGPDYVGRHGQNSCVLHQDLGEDQWAARPRWGHHPEAGR